MEAKAIAKFVRVSPRKVGVVLDLIRGKDVKYAEAVLKHTPKAACEPLLKLLKSAMANAENNHDMDVSRLYVAECNATAGPIHQQENFSHHPCTQGKRRLRGGLDYGSES